MKDESESDDNSESAYKEMFQVKESESDDKSESAYKVMF